MFKYGFKPKPKVEKVEKTNKHLMVIRKIQEQREKKDLENLSNIYIYMHTYKWIDGGFDEFTRNYLNKEIRVRRFQELTKKGKITTKYQSKNYFTVDLWN